MRCSIILLIGLVLSFVDSGTMRQSKKKYKRTYELCGTFNGQGEAGRLWKLVSAWGRNPWRKRIFLFLFLFFCGCPSFVGGFITVKKQEKLMAPSGS